MLASILNDVNSFKVTKIFCYNVGLDISICGFVISTTEIICTGRVSYMISDNFQTNKKRQLFKYLVRKYKILEYFFLITRCI